MSLTIKTNRMLWGRAASRCAIKECRRELVIDATETDDPSLVGEAAHIVAEQPHGPRGDVNFPVDKLNKYDNLILLCNVHHKQIDDQMNLFTVDYLKRLKNDHEKWVRETLITFDPIKQQDDERWAAYIEEWAVRLALDQWYEATYPLLQPTPCVSKKFLSDLRAIPEWLLSRIWPNRYPELCLALECLRLVVNDFVNVFGRHSVDNDRGEFECTKKFYKIGEWNPEKYGLLADRFDFHVDLIHDLICEMTRAANYVCDMIRSTIDANFRIREGVLLIRKGMGMDLIERTYRLEYTSAERTGFPYPGLDRFLQIRETRDVSFGRGKDPTMGDGGDT